MRTTPRTRTNFDKLRDGEILALLRVFTNMYFDFSHEQTAKLLKHEKDKYVPGELVMINYNYRYEAAQNGARFTTTSS